MKTGQLDSSKGSQQLALPSSVVWTIDGITENKPQCLAVLLFQLSAGMSVMMKFVSRAYSLSSSSTSGGRSSGKSIRATFGFYGEETCTLTGVYTRTVHSEVYVGRGNDKPRKVRC